MNETNTQLLVIGAGPGGYVAAIRAAQLGIATTIVEGGTVGGTCLNIGCIPSKALIHAAGEFQKAVGFASADSDSGLGITVEAPRIDLARTVRWKDDIVSRLTGGVGALLKKNGVTLVSGWARIVDGKSVRVHTRTDGSDPADMLIHCEHLLLATGSEAVSLPGLPFGRTVISATEALSPQALPRRLVVVGAGYIGLELGIAYAKLGARVTVVEALDRILPGYDEELTRPVKNALHRMGIEVRLGCSVQGFEEVDAAPAESQPGASLREPSAARPARLRLQDADGSDTTLDADQVLVAVGRRPRTEGWGLETLMLDMAGRAVKVDEQCRTSMRDVWAIGDLSGEPMLAHRAMAQGEMVAELVAGRHRRFAPAVVAAVCYTDPEVVVAGLSPGDAGKAGIDHVTAQFPFSANGRAMTLESTDGFVRVVARRDDHLIIGWQAVGAGVSELSSAFAQSIEMCARLEDIAHTIHAHPTLGEAVQEAALRALGQALHI